MLVLTHMRKWMASLHYIDFIRSSIVLIVEKPKWFDARGKNRKPI